MGDEKFEKALETAKKVVETVEEPKNSPDGTEKGMYKEILGMPKEEQNRLALNIGIILKQNEETLQMKDQQLRAIAYIACQKHGTHLQIKNYESFATGYMEAAHDVYKHRPPLEVGAKLMGEIIVEQNLQAGREAFSMKKEETEFVSENVFNQIVQATNLPKEKPIIKTPSPEDYIQNDELKKTFKKVLQTITEEPVRIEELNGFSEEGRAVVEYALTNGILKKENGYIMDNPDKSADKNFSFDALDENLEIESMRFAMQNERTFIKADEPDFGEQYDIPDPLEEFDEPKQSEYIPDIPHVEYGDD